MKLVLAISGLLFCTASSHAQLVRSTDGRNDFSEQASPNPSGLGGTITSLQGSQTVQVGFLLGGQTRSNLETVTSLTAAPGAGGGPMFREEYVSLAPFIHGPPLIDFANPISLVFTHAVEEVGVDIIHRFGALPSTFPPGDVKVLAFDQVGTLIGSILTTATTGTYTDPSTWDFLAFETADRSASIKAITIFSMFGEFGIGPSVRFEEAGGLLPVPEPSTYGLFGAALLGIVLVLRKRSTSRAARPATVSLR